MANLLSQLLSNPFFWLIGANLASFTVLILVFISPVLKKSYFQLPPVYRNGLAWLNIGALWLLPLIPQPRTFMFQSSLSLMSGLAIAIGAAAVWITAVRQLGLVPSLNREGGLIVNGAYRIVRHPVYLGNILVPLGLTLSLYAAYALVYVPLAGALFGILALLEESELVNQFGDDYLRYRKKVPYRIIPYLF